MQNITMKSLAETFGEEALTDSFFFYRGLFSKILFNVTFYQQDLCDKLIMNMDEREFAEYESLMRESEEI